ncbi:MAG: hypothetical protein ABIR04_11350 [Cypionkella sp.]
MSLILSENAKFFGKIGLISKECLEMRRFSSDGIRSGRLRQDAKHVTIPAEAMLFRLYPRANDSGKSALYGVLALLSEWYWDEHRASERVQVPRLHIVRLIFSLLYHVWPKGYSALGKENPVACFAGRTEGGAADIFAACKSIQNGTGPIARFRLGDRHAAARTGHTIFQKQLEF